MTQSEFEDLKNTAKLILDQTRVLIDLLSKEVEKVKRDKILNKKK